MKIFVVLDPTKEVGMATTDKQMAYEMRKGAHNTLGIVSDQLLEAWNEYSAEHACVTIEIDIPNDRFAAPEITLASYVDGTRDGV